MAENSNTWVRHGAIPASVFDGHVFMLESEAINSSNGMILPVGILGGINSTAGMTATGNSGWMSDMGGLVPGGSSTSGLLLDMVPGLKPDAGMTVHWSIEEQSILEEGLVKYAEESNITKYIKISATLRDKTVRDVALRCRWMTKEKGKRRKLEEYFAGKKKDRKNQDSKDVLLQERLMDSLPKANMPPASQPHMAEYSYMMHHMNHNDRLLCEVPSVGGAIRHLLNENAQVFSQITTNLTTFKIQDNIYLFCRVRNNVTAILNAMRNMPGIMSRMSPLPVSLNEELANIILPSTSQLSSGS